MTNREHAETAWLVYEIARRLKMGRTAEEDCLKEHFEFVERVSKELSPELYEKAR